MKISLVIFAGHNEAFGIGHLFYLSPNDFEKIVEPGEIGNPGQIEGLLGVGEIKQNFFFFQNHS